MSRAGIASLSIIAIVLAFVVIAANLPLRLVAGDMLAETEYTDS
jgi:hypothetical protein